jgi:hypothetical protein
MVTNQLCDYRHWSVVKYCDMMIENQKSGRKQTAIAMERRGKCVPTAVSKQNE